LTVGSFLRLEPTVAPPAAHNQYWSVRVVLAVENPVLTDRRYFEVKVDVSDSILERIGFG